MNFGFQAGASAEFDALLYPQSNPGTLEYLNRQFSGMSALSTDAQKNYYGRAYEVYQSYTSDAAIDFARQVAQQAHRDERMESAYIVEYNDLASLQDAGPTMQRWIMANTAVRQMYHAQRCDGYSDSYVDQEPDQFGSNHYEYRMVTDKIVESTPTEWHSTQYLETLREGDRPLTLMEKFDVMSTWLTLESFLSMMGEDPTSRYGDKL